MNIYSKKQVWKLFLLLFAIFIGIGSLLYTNHLVNRLSKEERKKVEIWAEATRQLGQQGIEGVNINFLVKIIQNNETVPVILVNDEGNIISHRNLDTSKIQHPGYLEKTLEKMKTVNEPIEIKLNENKKHYIYYKDSIILTKLLYYPYIQLGVILLFIVIAYYAFSVSRKAEQNKVWVGLSKETAHQLGTPTSSLMAWVEMLKLKNVDNKIVDELEQDTLRLEKIAARFSRIGSKPVMKKNSLNKLLDSSKQYMDKRFSEKVDLQLNLPSKELFIPLDRALFEWVIENVCKNAYDAIEGEGTIKIDIKENKSKIYIDISDSGKGIPKSKLKTVFKPGFTTKKSGWGLGLSLSKRIIEDYHDGRIFVLQSDHGGKGTTIRIILKKEHEFA
ncbi:MAG: sensor histidine kinase [bacterium]